MNDAGTMPPKPLRPTLLQPGDVLLMMGRCQLSKLIAWASDSKYSHAALMLDDGQLVEAALSGSHIAPLAGHLLKFDDYAHIDAFRSVAVCGEADRLALITQTAGGDHGGTRQGASASGGAAGNPYRAGPVAGR
jgi:hypothetical protein